MAHPKGTRRNLWGAGGVLGHSGDIGHSGVCPTPPLPQLPRPPTPTPPSPCPRHSHTPLPTLPHPSPAHAPLPGSLHPRTLRMTPGRWKRGVTGHAGGTRTASWTPHRCHLQAPAVWLEDTGHMMPSKGLPPMPPFHGSTGHSCEEGPRSWGLSHGHPCTSFHHQLPLPCVILADTISVICEVSFFRNSSVPTSAKDRWPQASAAGSSPGGQTLAQPAMCSTDVPKHPPPGPPWAWGSEEPRGHTDLGQSCQKQGRLTTNRGLFGSRATEPRCDLGDHKLRDDSGGSRWLWGEQAVRGQQVASMVARRWAGAAKGKAG